MTTPGSNQDCSFQSIKTDWPKGYEIQVNQTHTDWRKTGSIYAVQDVKAFVKDNGSGTQSTSLCREIKSPWGERQGRQQYTVTSRCLKELCHSGPRPQEQSFYKDIMIKDSAGLSSTSQHRAILNTDASFLFPAQHACAAILELACRSVKSVPFFYIVEQNLVLTGRDHTFKSGCC